MPYRQFDTIAEKPRPAVQRKPVVQPKLVVGAARDRCELEADRLAELVLRKPDSDVPRSSARPSGGSFETDAGFGDRLSARHGGGRPLSEGTRASMENAFGTDFSGVRVHTDAEAGELSAGIGARAFTYGRDIYFGRGAYAPDSGSGRRLLAHELTHVVQQQGQAQSTQSIQRMQDTLQLPAQLPKSALPIPGNGGVYVKNDEMRLEGDITEVYVKKQISLTAEAALVNPHLKHWWFLFKVEHAGVSTWMQVDLIVSNGYRIIWNAAKTVEENLAYEQKSVPPGLTSGKVEDATKQLAREKQVYYNPTPPDPHYPRYSCQDFVVILAERLGITL